MNKKKKIKKTMRDHVIAKVAKAQAKKVATKKAQAKTLTRPKTRKRPPQA